MDWLKRARNLPRFPLSPANEKNDGICIPPFRRAKTLGNRYLAAFWLSVLWMNFATLSCSAFSDGVCAYTMWPDG